MEKSQIKEGFNLALYPSIVSLNHKIDFFNEASRVEVSNSMNYWKNEIIISCPDTIGYKQFSHFLIHNICYYASVGENLLLRLLATKDEFNNSEEKALQLVSDWLKIYSSGILGTTQSLVADFFSWGYVSTNGQVLYLHVHTSKSGIISLGGLTTEIMSIYSLARPSDSIEHNRVSLGGKNLDIIHIPPRRNAFEMDVLAVELSGYSTPEKDAIQQYNDCVYFKPIANEESCIWSFYIHSVNHFRMIGMFSFEKMSVMDAELNVEGKYYLDDEAFEFEGKLVRILDNPLSIEGKIYEIEFGTLYVPNEGIHCLSIVLNKNSLNEYQKLAVVLMPN